MARRKYSKLKAIMYEQEVSQAMAAHVIGRKNTYISRRLTGKEPFNTDEIELLGTLLHIPRDQWLDLFTDKTKSLYTN